ncbi:Glutamate-gated chloride channel [Nymphon striatum]|nr:Glutamate-gated chloride channel [Nymphon striatum]
MLVIVSWVSFWLDQNAVPARVALGVTTLLTMATQTSSINSSLPPVSYTKAIDVWTGVCLTFVFAALLEFALVNYASRSDVHKQQNKKLWEPEQANNDATDHIEDGPTTFAMKPLMRPGGPRIEKIREWIYPCLFVHLVFKRAFSYYLIQIYIPCCMLVIVSWVSFWLDQNSVPARVSLGVTTLLTMATQTSSINSSLPPVSYTKAIDVWTGVCLTFVFAALLEFALVNYASRSDVLKQQNKKLWVPEHSNIDSSDHIEDGPTTFAMKPLVRSGGHSVEKVRECEVHMQPRRNFLKEWAKKFSSRSKRIDVIARITFPVAFALFNVVYWSTYLLRMDEGDLRIN